MCSRRNSIASDAPFPLEFVRFSWVTKKITRADARSRRGLRNYYDRKGSKRGMKLKEKIEQLGAIGYILLWLLGVPIPVLLLFFLLRSCT